MHDVLRRHAEVSAQAAQLKAENASLLAQLDNAKHRNAALLEALQSAEAQARCALVHASTAHM